MKSREELVQTESYWMVKIQNDLFGKVAEFMEANQMNQSQLAAHLGVTKGYISQILNGDFDRRISSLVKLALAIGYVPDIEFRSIPAYIQKDKRQVDPNFRVVENQNTVVVENIQNQMGLIGSSSQTESETFRIKKSKLRKINYQVA